MRSNRHGDVVGGLSDVPDRARERDIEILLAAEPVTDNPGQLGLFALQPERMPRRFGDIAEIELRDQSVATVTVLEFWRDQALRDEWPHYVKVAQHVQRRRMKRRRAESGEVGSTLEYGHRNAMTNQIGRATRPTGPAPVMRTLSDVGMRAPRGFWCYSQ